MSKELFIGIIPAIFIFLIFLGFNVAPFFIFALVGMGLFLYSKSKGSMHPNKRKFSPTPVSNVAFTDIGGQDRAKYELVEALDFLIQKEKIGKYGIRPLKGILLTGPPGTGKTLMAKAAANYTDSVFVSASGSEFVEMYVGVGAGRIRDLFKEVRTLAEKNNKDSGIIFIDEIDVIGGKRAGQQHREYDQTLNQLLTEMDGMATSESPRVLIIAATNRQDMLDDALLRPGRFDRHIVVDLPDKKAREGILKLHAKNKPMHLDVNFTQLASETFGFSGAQLEAVTNEAAIYALRDKADVIDQGHLTIAVDKVMLGEKTDRETTQEERKRVAIHELGHAIMSEVVRPGSVSAVALSPRGPALGYVRHHPAQDQFLYTKEHLTNQMMVCLAGAQAEQLIYGNKSTGARGDYDQVMGLAQTLIESGLSGLGIVNLKYVNHDKVQDEISELMYELNKKVAIILKQYKKIFDTSLDILLKEENLSGERFRYLLNQYTPELTASNA